MINMKYKGLFLLFVEGRLSEDSTVFYCAMLCTVYKNISFSGVNLWFFSCIKWLCVHVLVV